MKSEPVHTPAATAPARWMVVDDTEGVRELIALLLAKITRIEICCYSSGPEALAAFAAAPGQFQFVVTDYDMPGMTGFELCRQMLAISPGLKILLATGSADIAPETAHRSGFCGLLNKPFPPAVLHRALEHAGVIPADSDTAKAFLRASPA